MADLNVFELTNAELRKSSTTTPGKKTAPKKFVKESKLSRRLTRKPFNIPANKLKLESLSFFKEDEGNEDVTVDYTPEDDVVLVIDPDMEDVPETTEEAETAAEELVGDHVCKCAICGANYVTDAEITEETEIKDEVCPVCGETGDQIVVGVITPIEEINDEDAEELDDVDTETSEEDETFDDTDFDFSEEEVEETEEEEEPVESFRRPLRRQSRRLESKRPTARRPVSKRPVANKPVQEGIAFDELKLNRMLTRFAKENYSNVKSVKILKGSIKGGCMTLEGIVTTTKGSKRAIKLVSEKFETARRMTLRFKEYGPFTESIKTSRPSFIIECVNNGKTIVPVTLSYSYKAKDAGIRESKNVYSVTGKVLSESVRRPATKRPVPKFRNKK